MPNPWILLAGVLAIAIAFLVGDAYGHKSEHKTLMLKFKTEKEQAVTEARDDERQKQEKINAIIKKQSAANLAAANSLADTLVRLQQRKDRASGMRKDAGTTDLTGTGAKLYREDATFLAREAARAEECRIGMIACRAYERELKQLQNQR